MAVDVTGGMPNCGNIELKYKNTKIRLIHPIHLIFSKKKKKKIWLTPADMLWATLTLGMHRVSSVWPIVLDRAVPFFRVKCHRYRIYAYDVNPLRMAIGFDCATNRHHRCCVNPHFVDDAVVTFAIVIVSRQATVSSCQMLQIKYEQYDHRPFHYHHHDRTVAIQNLEKKIQKKKIFQFTKVVNHFLSSLIRCSFFF